jgi:hypothetical protein
MPKNDIPQTEIPQPTIVYQNQPAAHRRAVYLCADEKFIPCSLFLANQIATAHPARDFDICLVSAAPIAPHPLFEALGIRLVQIDTASMDRQVQIKSRIGFATYLRIFMPRLWIDDYDQLLYLDGDVFYQRGDISALLKHKLNGLPLAGVPEIVYWGRRNRISKDFYGLRRTNQPHFNAGILLIDVKCFVNEGFSDAAVRLMVTDGAALQSHDQTALNVVAESKWAVLPVQWNYQYNHRTMLWSAHVNVCFFHFNTSRKPFFAKYGAHARRFTTPYRMFFATHFPELVVQIHDGMGGPKKLFLQVAVMIFNLRALHGLMELEQLTDGDFDIRPIAAQPLRR